jgi:hypothetical protein
LGPLDLALVLAVDVSASVDHDEFALMIGGLARALEDPSVVAAIAAGPHQAIAVAALFWSEGAEVAVPWARLADARDAQGFAAALDDAPRLPRPGATALGEGMAAGLALLATTPGEPRRLVLDVSGDGRGNRGRPSAMMRDLAVAAGVTVNALAVVNEEPDLAAHYAAEVIGGPGAFVMECADYAAFAEGMRRKLLREIRGGAAPIV